MACTVLTTLGAPQASAVTITEKRTSNYGGGPRRHWTILAGDRHVANLGKSSGAWTKWSVLPVDRAREYQTFSSKAAAFAYAATL
jgi:hypothetical protein